MGWSAGNHHSALWGCSMSAHKSSPTASPAARSITALGRSHGWRIAFGVVTTLAGLLVIAWPGVTLVAVAVLVGLDLIVAGVFRIVTAFALDNDRGGARVLFVLLGLLLIVVGILCLRSPFQTT